MLAPATMSTSISQRQWLHLQSAPNNMSAMGPAGGAGDMAKKRRILQPHLHNQQQHLRPHSGITVTPAEVHHSRKAPPPTLMIPFFDHRHDTEISTSSLSVADPYDDDAISPRTMPPTTTTTNTNTSSKLVLRPCHVCHRKPSTKVMLDAYADCELCGQRACYICLRECNALNCAQRQPTTSGGGVECFDTEMGYHDDHPVHGGRQRKICSLCAIEGLTDTGQEIVWCLDCVRREGVHH